MADRSAPASAPSADATTDLQTRLGSDVVDLLDPVSPDAAGAGGLNDFLQRLRTVLLTVEEALHR